MSAMAIMLNCTSAAAGCIVLGALVANIESVRPAWLENELRHSVIAFGGGVLVSAVALVLVPEGSHLLSSPVAAAATFITGGIFFFGIERFLGTRRREKPQLAATLLDFVPESVALGGMFASGAETAPVLALLIGLQNLPEGFNSYRELQQDEARSPARTLLLLAATIPLGPLCGLIGMYFLASFDRLLGGIMLFAAGGILYLIFQDIAPQSRLERHWGPAVGAVLGFGVGMLGQLFIASGPV